MQMEDAADWIFQKQKVIEELKLVMQQTLLTNLNLLVMSEQDIYRILYI